MIQALLTASYLLNQDFLKRDGLLSRLHPKFYLIGSVPEGTRLFKASEIDVTVQFESQQHEEHALQVDKSNACEVIVPRGNLLQAFSWARPSDGHRVFCYSEFMRFFLEEVKISLARIHQSGDEGEIKWPDKLHCRLDWEPCMSCHAESDKARNSVYSPQTHCQSCFPAVTHTKLGACLVFLWGKERLPLTMDLIPVLSIEDGGSGILGLFDCTIKTLLEKKPVNWVRHIKAIVERDRLLPEALGQNVDESEARGALQNLPIKLLNYEPDMNYIIRPWQAMQVKEFERHARLREVYIHAKAAKEFLGIKVQSYLLKKIIFQHSVKQFILSPNVSMERALFTVLSHREVKKAFEQRIRFEDWKEDKDNELPMGRPYDQFEIPIDKALTEEESEEIFMSVGRLMGESKSIQENKTFMRMLLGDEDVYEKAKTKRQQNAEARRADRAERMAKLEAGTTLEGAMMESETQGIVCRNGFEDGPEKIFVDRTLNDISKILYPYVLFICL